MTTSKGREDEEERKSVYVVGRFPITSLDRDDVEDSMTSDGNGYRQDASMPLYADTSVETGDMEIMFQPPQRAEGGSPDSSVLRQRSGGETKDDLHRSQLDRVDKEYVFRPLTRRELTLAPVAPADGFWFKRDNLDSLKASLATTPDSPNAANVRMDERGSLQFHGSGMMRRENSVFVVAAESFDRAVERTIRWYHLAGSVIMSTAFYIVCAAVIAGIIVVCVHVYRVYLENQIEAWEDFLYNTTDTNETA